MEWPWLALAALGASHGINPAMGWLFAVALGMQAGSARAVWRSLLPLAAGHAAAILVALSAVAAAGAAIPHHALRWIVAGMLFSLGVFRLLNGRHPRYGGMRVGMAGLSVWSFLMASAHGAGIMVAPFVLPDLTNLDLQHAHHQPAAAALGASSMGARGLEAALLHTAGYLLVTAALAVIVYSRVGLRLLNRAWINFDLVWTVMLFLTAAAAPFL